MKAVVALSVGGTTLGYGLVSDDQGELVGSDCEESLKLEGKADRELLEAMAEVVEVQLRRSHCLLLMWKGSGLQCQEWLIEKREGHSCAQLSTCLTSDHPFTMFALEILLASRRCKTFGDVCPPL